MQSMRLRIRTAEFMVCNFIPKSCTHRWARISCATFFLKSAAAKAIGRPRRRLRNRLSASKSGPAVCGLSGGVDSSVAAALVHRAVGDRQTCLFINNGLLREGEFESTLV